MIFRDLPSFFDVNSLSAPESEGVARQRLFQRIDLALSIELAKQTARLLPAGSWILLHGDLGSGKTTWVQNLLQEARKGQAEDLFGSQESWVSSPTYSLLNSYPASESLRDRFNEVLHLDLYRVRDVQELFYMGLDSAITSQSLVLIEWPNVLNSEEWRVFFSYMSLSLPRSVLKLTITDLRSFEIENVECRSYTLDFFSGNKVSEAFATL